MEPSPHATFGKGPDTVEEQHDGRLDNPELGIEERENKDLGDEDDMWQSNDVGPRKKKKSDDETFNE